MNKTFKIIWITFLALVIVVVGFVAYINYSLNKKYRGEPFDGLKVEGFENWVQEELIISDEDIERIKFKNEGNILFDYIENGNIYCFPSIPTGEDYIFDEIFKIDINSNKIYRKKIDVLKNVERINQFSGYYVQNTDTYNRVFNKEEHLMILNIDNMLMLFNTEDLSYEIVKFFEDTIDYSRRFKYLFVDKENIYYILNERDENNKYIANKKNILIIENLKNGEIKEIDLNYLNTINYSDFMHFENIGFENYIFYTDDNILKVYDVRNGQNRNIVSKDEYYFNPSIVRLTQDFYIEKGIYTSRYGIRIFNRNTNEVVETIVGNNRYGHIHNLNVYDDKYIIADDDYNINHDDNEFKLVDLHEEKIYSVDMKKVLNLKTGSTYRIIGIENNRLYIEVLDSKISDINNNIYSFKIKL